LQRWAHDIGCYYFSPNTWSPRQVEWCSLECGNWNGALLSWDDSGIWSITYSRWTKDDSVALLYYNIVWRYHRASIIGRCPLDNYICQTDRSLRCTRLWRDLCSQYRNCIWE
jgi:hypothetical protein